MESSLQKQKPRLARTPGYGKIISVLLLAELVSAFETAMIFIALPTFMVEFGADSATVGWAATSFLLVAAASAAICGRLGDVYGRKKLLVIVLCLSVVGSLISFSFGTIEGIIIGRAVQGAAGAILPLCLGIAREALPKERVPGAIAIVSGSAFVAGASGSLIAGLLLDVGNWKAIFIFAGALGVVAAVVCAWGLAPSRVPSGPRLRIDYVGGILFAPAVAMVLFGLKQVSAWGLTDIRTLGFLIGGLLIASFWVRWELRVDNPMINLRLLTGNKMALTTIATAVLNVGPNQASALLGPMILLGSLAAPVGLGVSSSVAGGIGFVTALLSFLCTPISGRIAAKLGARSSLMLGTLISFVGFLSMFWTLHHLIGFIISNFTVGLGVMFIYTAFPNLVAEAVPMENTGEAMGVNTVTRTIFQAISTSIISMMIASSVAPGSQMPTESGYQMVFILVGVACVTGFLLAMIIKDKRLVDAGSEGQTRVLAVEQQH